MEKEKTRFRELYYSSLLQQRQENETNRIKIALISIGATIASIVGTIKGIQSLSIPYLPLVILIAGYAPWICLLCVLFIKLKVDEEVIDEKISTITTETEYQDTPKKALADKLDSIFHWSLIASLIGIICISTYILITAFITGGKEMSKKETTKEAVIHTVVDRESTHEESYGGRLPGGLFNPDQEPPKQEPPKQEPPKQEPPKQDQDQDKK